MGFHLQISVKHDPLESSSAAHPPPSAIIVLNGLFDDLASRKVLATVADLFGKGADSVIVEMQSVRIDEQCCVDSFVAAVMGLRDAGQHVQIAVREPDLHAALSRLGRSRDWLLSPSDLEIQGGRHGIYVDTPTES